MTGADYFAEILRHATIVAEVHTDDRELVTLQYVLGASVLTASRLYDEHAYAEAQDLIALCAAMSQEANDRILATDPNAQDFAARAMARLAGIPIPEPKIPQDLRDDEQAAKAWAREILQLAASSPERSFWLTVDDKCCFGGSVDACGLPIGGVQIIADGNAISAACYCSKHGKIMADVIAEQRAASGSMTAEEIDRIASGEPSLDDLFGKWPGDETDEQLASAIEGSEV